MVVRRLAHLIEGVSTKNVKGKKLNGQAEGRGERGTKIKDNHTGKHTTREVIKRKGARPEQSCSRKKLREWENITKTKQQRRQRREVGQRNRGKKIKLGGRNSGQIRRWFKRLLTGKKSKKGHNKPRAQLRKRTRSSRGG